MISAAFSQRNTESCSNGVFNFGDVNYRKITVANGNVHTESSCVGPFEGQASPDDVTASLSRWGLEWHFDADVRANGDVSGANTSGLTWSNVNTVKYNIALSSLSASYNTVAFAVSTDDKHSTYVLSCVNRSNLTGIFNAFGVETFNNAVSGVSVFFAHDTRCDAVVDEDSNEDVFDCIDRLIERVNTLERENGECRDENDALVAEVNSLKDNVSSLKDKVTDLVTENNELADSLEGCEAELEETTVLNEELTANLESCEASNAELEVVVNRLTGELKSCEALKESWINQYNAKNDELTVCLNLKNVCETELAGLENDLIACKRIVAERDATIEELRRAIDTCTENADQALRDLLANCESRVEGLEVDIQNLNDTISTLQSALENCLNSCEEEVVQDGNVALKNCLKDLAARNDTITSLNGQIIDLQALIASLNRQLDTTNASLTTCNTNLRTCENNYNDCQDDRSELQAHNLSLTATINCRENNLVTFGASVSALIDSLTDGCEVERFD